MSKINMTLNIPDYEVNNFENWMRQNADVIDFKVIPDTSEMYENDKHFQFLCKQVKISQKNRDKYYNENRKK